MLNAGRLDAAKNAITLVRAMRRVSSPTPVNTLVCGDGPLRLEIEQLIAEHAAPPTIRVAGYASNLWGLMKRATVFVSPSRFEGSPNVVLEERPVRGDAGGDPDLAERVVRPRGHAGLPRRHDGDCSRRERRVRDADSCPHQHEAREQRRPGGVDVDPEEGEPAAQSVVRTPPTSGPTATAAPVSRPRSRTPFRAPGRGTPATGGRATSRT